MKRSVLNFLLTLATFVSVTTWSHSASAQVGTYCSAKTQDGFWAAKFGVESVESNCGVVLQTLRNVTRAEVSASTYGYYNLNAVNRVWTRCGFYYRNILTSVGGYALQNAINTASNSGLTHCLFWVNDYF